MLKSLNELTLMEQVIHHLPAIVIILPLMAAPLCVIFRNRIAAWSITAIISASCAFIAALLLSQVSNGSVIHYHLGGWSAPSGIEYYIDITNALILLLVSSISTIVAIYSLHSVDQEISRKKHYLFYAGWLLCLTGLMGITITGDAFNVFVFLEISSLSTYMLIALGKERPHSFMASFRYLIMGSIGASFILIGIGFLYAATGTLNMQDIAQRIPDVSDSRTVVVAFAFITVGLLIKTAVFPVHNWLPNAYQYSPSSVSSFLAGTATKVSLYVLIRFMFNVFGTDYSFSEMLLSKVLLPLAIVGFIVMSLVAIFQTDLRRMLAYSSIAQIGYILAGIAMANQAGISSAMIHIINHGLIKSALFMATGCIIYRLGSAHIQSLRQLISSMPITVAAFVVGGISLIGMPLTAGFISKWNLISAALDNDWLWLAILVLVSSILAVIYIGKVIQMMCFSPSNQNDNKNSLQVSTGATLTEAPTLMWVSTWLLLLASLYLGLNSENFVGLTQDAADQILGGIK